MKVPDIIVVKENGEREKFKPSKVHHALRRSGLSPSESRTALKRLYPQLKDGITTRSIYSKLYAIIRDMRPEKSHKYNLKRALLQLGPAGYDFEDFTARLMQSLGYNIEVRQLPVGKCITHEVDVIARKAKEKIMVECKFRNRPGDKCRSKTALYIYARFLDLRDGAKIHSKRPFTKPMLVTNAKFSTEVIKYANCMGMRLLGWRYPLKNSLEVLIDRTKCYPVSVIRMNRKTLSTFLNLGFVSVLDLPKDPKELSESTGLSLSTTKRIVKEAEYARS
ncbi:MAG: restriction endonuclease [Candidatus Micrarchaeia archaeon]